MAPTLGDDWKALVSSLGDNWDGYGGKPITAEAIASLQGLYVVPCPTGGLVLETHQDGFDLEIEIAADGKLNGVSFQRNTTTYPNAGRDIG